MKATLKVLFDELGIAAQPFSTEISRDAASRVVQMGDSATSIRAAVGNREYRLFPIPVKTSQFWLGVECKFDEVVDEERLGGLSLVVFRGPVFESDKEALFRAEWDSEPSALHAQPHWHLYGATITRAAEEESGSTFSHGRGDNLESIHFAMSASWHTEPFGQHLELDVEGGRNWLLNCMKYVVLQLRYLEGE